MRPVAERRCSKCDGTGHNARTCKGVGDGRENVPVHVEQVATDAVVDSVAPADDRKPVAPRKEDGARVWPADVMTCLGAMEVELTSAGFPRMSEWWWETLRAFYAGGKRQLVARVGRRGGKSSTVSRVAVAEILTCRHRVPPGDTGMVTVVSVDRREAADRIKTMHAILDALGIPNKPKADGIELPERNYGIAIRTGSIAGVSGFTCICALGDEVSKWKDSDTGVNPADQVLASWRPTMATMPDAKMFLLSSPMGTDDAHARAFDEGDTSRQMVAYAPTWIAHPALTREGLQRDEPNVRVFKREYEAIPSPEIEGSLLTASELERATRHWKMQLPRARHEYIAAIDTGSRSQVWTLIIVEGTDAGPRVVLAHDWPGTQEERPNAREVLGEVRAVCAVYGLQHVRVHQQTCPERLRIAAANVVGLALMPEDLNGAEYVRAFDSVAIMSADGAWELPDLPELRQDLLKVKKKVTASGTAIELGKESDQMRAYYSLALVLATYRGVPSPDPDARVLTEAEELAEQEKRMWEPVLGEIREQEYDA